MSVLESLPLMLFVMLMVFAVLAVLFLIIQIFSLVFQRFITRLPKKSFVANARENSPAEILHSSIEQPIHGAAYGGELILRDVDEPTAALIMAIVSDETKIPLSELCFRSIRKKA